MVYSLPVRIFSSHDPSKPSGSIYLPIVFSFFIFLMMASIFNHPFRYDFNLLDIHILNVSFLISFIEMCRYILY